LSFVLLLLGAALAGCQPLPPTVEEEEPASTEEIKPASTEVQPAPPEIQPPPELFAKPRPANTRTAYMIVLKVVRVDVPVGQASESPQLWGYLDEEPLALKAAVLGLNGFRVGIGSGAAWTDFEQLLQNMTGQVRRNLSAQGFSGEVAQIPLKLNQPAQVLFVTQEDRTLSGAEYPPGDNILGIAMTVNEANPREVMLTIVPQLRTTRKYSQVVEEYGKWRMRSAPLYFTMEPLIVQVRLKVDDFLVIGPGEAAQRQTSLGRQFLIQTRDGVDFESLLILLPQIEAVDVPVGNAPLLAPSSPAEE
jgi:hypothetical protein